MFLENGSLHLVCFQCNNCVGFWVAQNCAYSSLGCEGSPALSLISEQQSWGYFLTLGLFLYWGFPTPCASFLLLCPALKTVPGEMFLLFFLLSGELLWADVQLVGREKLVAFPCSICTLERTPLNSVHGRQSRYDLWEFNSKHFRKAKVCCSKFANMSCRRNSK